MSNVTINYQVINFENDNLPDEMMLANWCQLVVNHLDLSAVELCIRITDDNEVSELNKTYRQKEGTTNILSFPFEPIDLSEFNIKNQENETGENDASQYLGDLVISHPKLKQEAKETNKLLLHHYAHIVIHGMLHLLGYNHITDSQAEVMESIEITLLDKIDIPNPYS